MVDEIRVVQYGLGPIGCALAALIVERPGLELVGGVDIDPTKVGKDAGEVIGVGHPLGFTVVGELSEARARTEADLVMHATDSYLEVVKSQIIEILEAGLDVVSTAEELSFPWLAHPEEAAEIDAVAKQARRTVLGTGVNPGFIMDSLPLALTAICQRIDRVDVTRIIDASTRRASFQAKIGSGMTIDDFSARMDIGKMGHVGLLQSMGMVFHTLGKELVQHTSTVKPVVADRTLKTEHLEVQPGQVSGLKQVARGFTDEGEFMTLNFEAALGVREEGDTIKITGKPNLEAKLRGTDGDLATVAIAVNAARRVRAATPGLVTMCDLPIVTAW